MEAQLNNFTKTTSGGVDWYTTKKDNPVYKALISLVVGDSVVIYRDRGTKRVTRKGVVKSENVKDRYQWAKVSLEQAVKMTKTNDNLFEVIAGQRACKVYFDIDSKRDSFTAAAKDFDSVILEARTAITTEFPGARLAISGSIGEVTNKDGEIEGKISFHVVVYNWVIGRDAILQLRGFCKKYESIGFDWKVYNNGMNMKLPGQSKPNSERIQTVIETDNLEHHFITSGFLSPEQLVFFEQSETNGRFKDTDTQKKIYGVNNFDICEIKQLELKTPGDRDWNNSTPMERLSLIPNDNRLPHNGRLTIVSWAKTAGISWESVWAWLLNSVRFSGMSVEAYLAKWKTNFDCTAHTPGDNIALAIAERFYPRISDDLVVARLRKQFDTPTEIETVMCMGRWLSTDMLIPGVKFNGLVSGMGSNKTGTIVRAFVHGQQKVVWISPRITLTYNTTQRLNIVTEEMERLNIAGLNFVHYLQFTPSERKTGIQNALNDPEVDGILMSIQSLHYLESSGVHFDYVVIDEIECVLQSFARGKGCHEDRVYDNWRLLKFYIQQCKTFFYMDALTTRVTTDYVLALAQGQRVVHYDTEIKMDPRSFRVAQSFVDWTRRVHDALEAGEKIYIFAPYKLSGKFAVKTIGKIICEKMHWTQGKEVLIYNANETREKKKLVDCNTVWGDTTVRCIITNSCISVGVNFDTDQVFDRIFCVTACGVLYRDVFQSLARVRKPKNSRITIYSSGAKLPKCEYTGNHWDAGEDDHGILEKLISNFALEMKANSNKDTLRLFAEKCNILFRCTDDQKRTMTREAREQLEEIIKTTDAYYMYESIPDITSEEADHIKDLMFSQLETSDQRLQHEKFRFKYIFGDNEAMAELYWNTKRVSFAENMFHFYLGTLNKRTNAIADIYRNNKLDINSAFPSYMEGNKDFFKDFCFKGEPKCYNTDLCVRMINTYFDSKFPVILREGDSGEIERATESGIEYIENECESGSGGSTSAGQMYSRVTINGKRYTKLLTRVDFLQDRAELFAAFEKAWVLSNTDHIYAEMTPAEREQADKIRIENEKWIGDDDLT